MDRKIPTFTINLGEKCAECRQGGAYANGLCGKCTTKAIQSRTLKSAAGRAVAERFKQLVAKHK
jgi:hypothetical protein